MENVVIQPGNQKHFFLLKALLEEMNVKFSTEKTKSENILFSDFEKKLIDKGLEDIENRRIKTQDEAHKIFETCFK